MNYTDYFPSSSMEIQGDGQNKCFGALYLSYYEYFQNMHWSQGHINLIFNQR
jgi:hypothetical protein